MYVVTKQLHDVKFYYVSEKTVTIFFIWNIDNT